MLSELSSTFTLLLLFLSSLCSTLVIQDGSSASLRPHKRNEISDSGILLSKRAGPGPGYSAGNIKADSSSIRGHASQPSQSAGQRRGRTSRDGDGAFGPEGRSRGAAQRPRINLEPGDTATSRITSYNEAYSEGIRQKPPQGATGRFNYGNQVLGEGFAGPMLKGLHLDPQSFTPAMIRHGMRAGLLGAGLGQVQGLQGIVAQGRQQNQMPFRLPAYPQPPAAGGFGVGNPPVNSDGRQGIMPAPQGRVPSRIAPVMPPQLPAIAASQSSARSDQTEKETSSSPLQPRSLDIDMTDEFPILQARTGRTARGGGSGGGGQGGGGSSNPQTRRKSSSNSPPVERGTKRSGGDGPTTSTGSSGRSDIPTPAEQIPRRRRMDTSRATKLDPPGPPASDLSSKPSRATPSQRFGRTSVVGGGSGGLGALARQQSMALDLLPGMGSGGGAAASRVATSLLPGPKWGERRVRTKLPVDGPTAGPGRGQNPGRSGFGEGGRGAEGRGQGSGRGGQPGGAQQQPQNPQPPHPRVAPQMPPIPAQNPPGQLTPSPDRTPRQTPWAPRRNLPGDKWQPPPGAPPAGLLSQLGHGGGGGGGGGLGGIGGAGHGAGLDAGLGGGAGGAAMDHLPLNPPPGAQLNLAPPTVRVGHGHGQPQPQPQPQSQGQGRGQGRGQGQGQGQGRGRGAPGAGEGQGVLGRGQQRLGPGRYVFAPGGVFVPQGGARGGGRGGSDGDSESTGTSISSA